MTWGAMARDPLTFVGFISKINMLLMMSRIAAKREATFAESGHGGTNWFL